MMRGMTARRGAGRCLGLAAAAMLMLSAAPSTNVQAMTLINGGTPAVKPTLDDLTIKVRGHGGHGGGYRGGSAVHIQSYRAAPVYRSSGIRFGGYRSGGYRHAGSRFFFHRHHHHRRFFYGAAYYNDYYPAYYYRYRHRCRVIWTHYGPRRICHHRRHHHYRRYW